MESLNLEFLKNKKVHFIGIGGISMSSLALILKNQNIEVQGSDESLNSEVNKLVSNGVKVFEGHDKNNLKGVDIVVYSSAIGDDNEELIFARNNKLTILKRAELLAMIAKSYKTVISVAGSHGKTTASAMISEMLLKNNLNPTFHIGGVLNSVHSNHNIGDNEIFVTESCEYKDNFLFLHPDISVVLNVDADHLDYFGDLEGVKKSFDAFIQNTNKDGINIICKDDENSKELLKKSNNLTFGFSKNAHVFATNIKEYKPCYYSFDVVVFKYKLGNIKLNILGKHNILNALVCVLVGILLKLDFCDIKKAIENFSGVERRCQLLSDKNNIRIFHDYAHHPEQISKMIEIGKNLTQSKGKLFVVFEPHTYSRTKFLIKEFAQSLMQADEIILTPVYPARELASAGFDSLKLANKTKSYNSHVQCIKDFFEVKNYLLENVKEDDVVLILGAGTIEKLAKMFLD